MGSVASAAWKWSVESGAASSRHAIIPVRGGMTIHTNSERVKWLRKVIMELMLSRWPNVKVVKEMAERLGIEKPRFVSLERDEAENACILCGMCVNMCNDVVKAGVLGFAHTGIKREVVLPFNERSETCIVCGACAHVCPTGHIKMVLEDYRGKKPEFTLGSEDPDLCPNVTGCSSCAGHRHGILHPFPDWWMRELCEGV